MNRLFKLIAITLLISSTMSGCIKHDDFEITGKVVGYVPCSSMTDMRDAGFFIKINSPKNVGGTITTDGGDVMTNVVLVFQAERMLKDMEEIRGRIYFVDRFSEANCIIHPTDVDVPEAVFTEVEVLK